MLDARCEMRLARDFCYLSSIAFWSIIQQSKNVQGCLLCFSFITNPPTTKKKHKSVFSNHQIFRQPLLYSECHTAFAFGFTSPTHFYFFVAPDMCIFKLQSACFWLQLKRINWQNTAWFLLESVTILVCSARQLSSRTLTYYSKNWFHEAFIYTVTR